jgi:lipoprotein-releasing system permease protein
LFTRAERLISYRNLKPKKRDGFLKVISLFSFLGITLGVAILIIVMSVMNGFRTDLTNKILGLNPHVVIESYNENIEILKKEIKKEYKVSLFLNSYSAEAVVLTKENTKGVLIKGIDNTELKKFYIKDKIVEGDFNKFTKGTILIGGELAFNLNVKIGEKINIISSSFINTPFGDIPKQESFKIVGIFNSGFYEFDQNLVFTNLSDALAIFDKTKKDLRLEVYLEKPMNANLLKKNIEKNNKELFIYTWTDLNKSFFSALKVERNVMFLILTLIIIVAAFNIISGLTILIKNKTKEIAILKTLGLSNYSIKKSFFLTGLIIGSSATIAGTILGILFSINIEKIRILLSQFLNINIFPPDVYFLDKMPSEINFISVLYIFSLSILITAVASYFPAKNISKMEPTEALKYE